ncbi:MAG: ATP-dependent sacrificial sulfur transferase LarE [Candidatus Omnitrophota bacterium]
MNTNLLGKKVYNLQKLLRELKSVVVAYSGGADSSFLLYAARKVLGKDKVLAVIAQSPTYPKKELNSAKKLVRRMDVNYKIIRTDEFSDKNFYTNPPKRCYYCKKELFGKLNRIAKAGGYKFLADGSNSDDKKDYRAGNRAAGEFKVVRPLALVGLEKQEIRRLSKAVGLPTHDKPAQACLASRVPYFEKITRQKLGAIEKAEDYLEELGFRGVRVRYHEDIARIELQNGSMKRFLDDKLRKKVASKLRNLGFTYITLDLEGYKTGSLNRVLKQK